jgi:hypothetical protein
VSYGDDYGRVCCGWERRVRRVLLDACKKGGVVWCSVCVGKEGGVVWCGAVQCVCG